MHANFIIYLRSHVEFATFACEMINTQSRNWKHLNAFSFVIQNFQFNLKLHFEESVLFFFDFFDCHLLLLSISNLLWWKFNFEISLRQYDDSHSRQEKSSHKKICWKKFNQNCQYVFVHIFASYILDSCISQTLCEESNFKHSHVMCIETNFNLEVENFNDVSKKISSASQDKKKSCEARYERFWISFLWSKFEVANVCKYSRHHFSQCSRCWNRSIVNFEICQIQYRKIRSIRIFNHSFFSSRESLHQVWCV